jgi:hypothetical protein
MPRPRLLISSVTAAAPDVLTAHLQSVKTAAENCDAEVEFLYLVDPTAAEGTGWALTDAGIPWQHAGPKGQEATYAVSEATHHWSVPTFYWLGSQKESLLDHARAGKYDALLLVDSDLILAPDTIASLLACQKPIVSAVFWTKWQVDQPQLPNVWRTHPYGFEGDGESGADFLARLERRELVRVRGLGACTLLRGDGLAKASFRPIAGLPQDGMWQGEDRHFCLNAERAHVEMWADAWPDIFHAYRPSDAELIDDLPICNGALPGVLPSFGDLISFTLEPLEEPALAGYTEHVRGRLGALRLVPSLENALLSMRVGDERFLSLSFPASYPLAAYAGSQRLVRVRLLGAKPFRLPLPDGLQPVLPA